MFFNKNRPKDIWESAFQDISASEVYLAKKMTYYCLCFVDDIIKKLLPEITLGQRFQTIAFAKLFHYHLITKSQIVHNLFYGFLYEAVQTIYHQSVKDTFFFVDQTKNAEMWYMTSYFDQDFGGIQSAMKRYYNSLYRLSNSEDNIIPLEFEDFCQTIGPMLEELHQKYTST